jgi:hypothetical protein
LRITVPTVAAHSLVGITTATVASRFSELRFSAENCPAVYRRRAAQAEISAVCNYDSVGVK